MCIFYKEQTHNKKVQLIIFSLKQKEFIIDFFFWLITSDWVLELLELTLDPPLDLEEGCGAMAHLHEENF